MRLDILTSEWHKLLKPVLPHAATDKEMTEYRRVRLELGHRALYAVATDMATLAAERLRLGPANRGGDWPPVHVEASEAKSSLGLLPFDKDTDPMLQITVDRAPIPLGHGNSIDSWALTVDRPDDGLRLVLRDRRDPSLVTSLDKWRDLLLKALTRAGGRSLDGLDLRGHLLARWGAASRGTERLRLYTGPKPGDALLITVEDHFAGIWAIPQYLDSPAQGRAELPWAAELLPADVIDLRTASGVRTFNVDTGTGEVDDPDDDSE